MALAARNLPTVADELREIWGLDDPYGDPVVSEFGLQNAVFAWGDAFIEIVSPTQSDTAAERYMDRNGGDSGYMVVLQVPDARIARDRIADLGIRVVWETTYPDLIEMQLHPKDVEGAIVSLTWADPPGSWRWGGPEWTGRVPNFGDRSITALTVAVDAPQEVAAVWGSIVVAPVEPDADGALLRLDSGRQLIRFTPVLDQRRGLIAVDLSGGQGEGGAIGGVWFSSPSER